jgi:hypothetical protein
MNNPLNQTVPVSAVIGAFAGIVGGLYFFSGSTTMVAVSVGLGAMLGNLVHFLMNKEERKELSEAYHAELAEIEHKQNAIHLMKAMMYVHFHPGEEENIDFEEVEKWIRTKTGEEIKSWLNDEIGAEHGKPPDTFEEWFDWQSNNYREWDEAPLSNALLRLNEGKFSDDAR